MKKYILIISTLIISLLSTVTSLAGNYTWTGTTNTDWATGTNWSPSGNPSTNDTVTIVTHTNLPVLAANTTIKKFTMTSGTLDCNAYTLTISATASFNGGTINNGTLTCSGTSTLTFAGTTFGASVNATGNSILLSGSRFNSTFTAVKKGSSNDNGTGGNVFGGTTSLTDSGSGSLVLSNNSSSPDTFNAAVTINAASTGAIYVAHQGIGNAFNSTLAIKGGTVYLNYYGSAYYDGNISINAPSGSISFGASTGTATLKASRTISIASGGLTGGLLSLRNFTQDDASVSDTLIATGTATLYFEAGSTFKGGMVASAPLLKLIGSRFLGTTTLTHNTTSALGFTSNGGSYFGGTTVISRNCSGGGSWSMGTTTADTFATTTRIENVNVGSLTISNGVFLGKVTFRNQNVASGSDKFTIAACTFSDSVTLDNTTSGLKVGGATFQSTARLYVPSSYTGNLTFGGTTFLGTSPISLTLNSGTTELTLEGGTEFHSKFTYYGTRIHLNGAIFDSTTTITRYSNTADASDGGNVFNGTTTIMDSTNNHSHTFTMATTTTDDYNGNVTFYDVPQI